VNSNESELPRTKCTRNADAVVLMTDWPICREMEMEQIVAGMASRVFVDAGRMFAGLAIPSGVEYYSLGSQPTYADARGAH